MLSFPREYLTPTLLMSLLSLWVLIGVSLYLNSYTRRRYFTIWSAAWMFYALWLTLSLSLPEDGPSAWLLMLKQTCVGFSAIFMLWGAATFLNQKVPDRVFGLLVAFLVLWSYLSAFNENPLRTQLPVFALVGLGSGLTAYSFFRFGRQGPFRGASLLSVGFLFWGVYLASYPLLQEAPNLASLGNLFSAVLQLFIALSMIILVLEEVRASNAEALQQIEAQKSESAGLRSRIVSTEERYRSLFTQASEAIIITSADDLRILELNETAARLLGVDVSDHAIARLTDHVQLGTGESPTPATGPEWYAALCEQHRVQIVRRDGTTIPVEITGSPVEFEGVTTYQLFLRELTEKGRLEQQLRQAEKLSALGQMISGIAHELNNPLAVIKGYLDLMLSRPELDGRTRTELTKVVHESNRAAKLVSNFLSFARERAPQRRAIQLNDLIRRVIELREIDLRSAGTESVLELDPQLPCTQADPDQLEQVLVNLIGNALHALVERRANRCLRLSTKHKGELIQVRVEDNGPGVPTHVLPHIFEPFFTTKEVGCGTGLGLSIAHSILSEHKGRILYETSSLGGACFVLELPVVAGTPEAAPRPNHPEGSEAEALDAFMGDGAARILVVDDEAVLANLLGEILSSLGHQPTTCYSAIAALQIIEAQEFDLILSDFRMPVMNGRELHERLRQTRPELAARMIFLTGDVVNQETRAFLENTGNIHLPKPFRLEAVARAIHEVLHRPKPAKEERAPAMA